MHYMPRMAADRNVYLTRILAVGGSRSMFARVAWAPGSWSQRKQTYGESSMSSA